MPETKFVCPKCGVTARSPKELAPGTQIRCPSCKVVFNYQPEPPATPPKPRPSATTRSEAAAPPPRPSSAMRSEATAPPPRPSSRRRDDRDDDRDDDRPRRRPKKKESNNTLLLVIGGVAAVVLIVAGAAVAVVAFSGKDTDKQGAQTNSQPIVANNNQPNMRPPGGPMVAGGPNVGGPANGANTPPMTASPTTKPDSAPPDRSPITSAPSGTGSVQDVYDYVLKSTVWILNIMSGGKAAEGTGSVVDANERLILTNYHVVANMQQLVVFFPIYEGGKPVPERDRYKKILRDKVKSENDLILGELIATDPLRDLALVRVSRLPPGTETLPLAKSMVNIGQTVHSVGNPGVSDALWVYTQGAVRAVYRKKWKAGGGPGDDLLLTCDSEVVETQSPTNPGDSGGPLVNDRGELIGVTEGYGAGRQISLFISLNEARDFIEREYQRKFAKPWKPVVRTPLKVRGGGGGGDVTALINALDDRDPKNRASAAKSLGDMGPDAKLALRRLLKALKDTDETTCRFAADALSKIGAPGRDDLPTLTEALKDQKSEVRRYAAVAIGQIGPDAASAAGPLVEALSDEDERVREGLVRSLGSLGPGAKSAAAPGLTKALQDQNKSVRVAAAAALTNLLSPPVADDVPTLVMILKLQDPDASVFGARGLAKLGKQAKAAIPDLTEAAKRPDPTVRREAITALAAVGPEAKTAVPLYLAAIKDGGDSGVRQSALLALAQLGKELEKDKDAIAAVIDAVKDQDPAVKKAAMAAVGKLGAVIGVPGAKQVMPAVIDALQSKDATLRDQAHETIAGLGPLAKDAVNPLINMMEKQDIKLYVKQKGDKPFMQEADEAFLDKIAKTLGKIGQPAVKRLLQGVTINSNVGLIIGTCRALGEIGPPAKEALPALALLSRGLSEELGAEADRAMRKIRK